MEEGDVESQLYRPPHSDGATSPWPSDEAVEKLREVRKGMTGGGEGVVCVWCVVCGVCV